MIEFGRSRGTCFGATTISKSVGKRDGHLRVEIASMGP